MLKYIASSETFLFKILRLITAAKINGSYICSILNFANPIGMADGEGYTEFHLLLEYPGEYSTSQGSLNCPMAILQTKHQN